MDKEEKTMKILVTGGAGYVGCIVAERLLQDGYEVVILDNLQQGHREALPGGAEFICADICDPSGLEEVFRSNSFDAVMHMAAETVVEFSMTDPWRFFYSNVWSTYFVAINMKRYFLRV